MHQKNPYKPIPAGKAIDDLPILSIAKKPAKVNHDSGYHGLSEDDMETDQATNLPSLAHTHDAVEEIPLQSAEEEQEKSRSEDHSTAEPSFQSAKEEISTGDFDKANAQKDRLQSTEAEVTLKSADDALPAQGANTADQGLENTDEKNMEDKELEEDLVVDESRTPSQGSSPPRPIVRKSSLTFAALPAREPLTTKKSLGARVSRTSHLDQSRGPASRGSFLERFTGGKSLGGYKQPDSAHDVEIDDGTDIERERPALAREESEDSKMTKLHNKSSTQRLHDRINMLGKGSQPTRPTKSIPAVAAVSNLTYPELPSVESHPQSLQQTATLAEKFLTALSTEEEEDDWIQFPRPQQNAFNLQQVDESSIPNIGTDSRNGRADGDQILGGTRVDEDSIRRTSQSHQQSANSLGLAEPPRVTATLKSDVPFKEQAHSGVDHARQTNTAGETATAIAASTSTPVGSPSSKRYVDGPLNASKSKLQSIMKSARGLFSSSAGVSAQAKMETLSPPFILSNGDMHDHAVDSTEQRHNTKGLQAKTSANSAIGRKTRSSTEKEEQMTKLKAEESEPGQSKAERHQAQDDSKTMARDAAQVGEPVKSVRQSPRRVQNQEVTKEQPEVDEQDVASQSMCPPSSNAPGQPHQAQKLKGVRRPIRPAKEDVPKPKPQPVAIRVGTLSHGIRMNNATLSSSLQDSLPSQGKQPIIVKKPSNVSIHSAASNNSLKSSVSSAATKPKALIAAERKREQVSYYAL